MSVKQATNNHSSYPAGRVFKIFGRLFSSRTTIQPGFMVSRYDGEVFMLYFAYGANMDVETLQARKVDFQYICNGKVRNKRLVFHMPGEDGTGKADLMDDHGSHAHGVVYDVPEESLAGLDVYEGVERGRYRRQEMLVQTSRGEIPCVVYQAAKFRSGLKPSPTYLECMIRGAAHHGLPDHYRTFLESHATMDAKP